jgi:26S proteasome regulatory subunit N9
MANDPNKIPDLLEELRDEAPEDQQHYFIDFEDFWERKLWHELTDGLLGYFKLSESGKQRIPLFDTFIKSFANKINQLKLVKLGLETLQFRGAAWEICLVASSADDDRRERPP